MGNKKINYFDIFLGIILNILVVIAAILIYNAYIIKPKLEQNARYNDSVSLSTEEEINGATSSPY